MRLLTLLFILAILLLTDGKRRAKRTHKPTRKPTPRHRYPSVSPQKPETWTCANTCIGFINDGVCSDGGIGSVTPAWCPWGWDCDDCGDRAGQPYPTP